MDTVIGTKGVYLSGGEQQRIAIARAMLKNAPILILDEATAFADPDNETKVQAAFAELSRGKTVLMIAHRLSTVTHADRICVVEDGPHRRERHAADELLEQGGIFRRMWDRLSDLRAVEGRKGGVKDMIQRLQKRYALSEQGAKDLVKGCIACVVQNLVLHGAR